MSAEKARELAVGYFAQGFNCSESVLLGLAEAFGLDCNCSPRIATAFGGGMAGCGKVCGALTGAMMALSLKFGRDVSEDTDAKATTYANVRELSAAFAERFGSIHCFDLIGIDLTTPEGLQRATELDLHNNLCPKYVAFAAEQAAGMITDNRHP
jgi:C_GCAxxG_C_C family probable redox protein